MTFRAFCLSLPATLMLTTAVFAQERMRSADYDGEDAIEVCYDWQTGFEYTRCERMPLPGQAGVMGQVYTLEDGSRRTLTVDPRSAPVDPVAAAAETSETLAATLGTATPPQEDIGAAIDAAARSRNGGTGQSQPDSAAVIEDGDAPQADEPAKSSLVEENFVLPPVVAFIPGRAEILPMATGHLNRIETPFSQPEVRTSAEPSAINVQFDQNFVYVSVTQPVTLFIHEKGHPDPAIVVSLVPQLIAPRQVKFTLPPSTMETVRKNAASLAATTARASGAAPTGPAANSRGVRRASPQAAATNTLAHLIQTFAQGRIPRGFRQVSLQGYDPAAFCGGASGVSFSFRQGAAIASNDYIIVRGMASSGTRTTLDERKCARHPDTLAVAFNPRTIIGPDQPTDFFVLIRRPNASIQTARGN